MGRDDFTPVVRDKIGRRVAFVCSYPECGAPTVGPGGAPDATHNVGTACHIAGASPGGPRYDPDMTPEQRSSADNGIWMCATHGRQIDCENGATFPVGTLRQWKAEAESRAGLHIGKQSTALHKTVSSAQLPPDLKLEVTAVELWPEMFKPDQRAQWRNDPTPPRLKCLWLRVKVKVTNRGDKSSGVEFRLEREGARVGEQILLPPSEALPFIEANRRIQPFRGTKFVEETSAVPDGLVAVWTLCFRLDRSVALIPPRAPRGGTPIDLAPPLRLSVLPVRGGSAASVDVGNAVLGWAVEGHEEETYNRATAQLAADREARLFEPRRAAYASVITLSEAVLANVEVVWKWLTVGNPGKPDLVGKAGRNARRRLEELVAATAQARLVASAAVSAHIENLFAAAESARGMASALAETVDSAIDFDPRSLNQITAMKDGFRQVILRTSDVMKSDLGVEKLEN